MFLLRAVLNIIVKNACLFVYLVGLLHIGNWNSWPSSLGEHICLYWCNLVLF